MGAVANGPQRGAGGFPFFSGRWGSLLLGQVGMGTKYTSQGRQQPNILNKTIFIDCDPFLIYLIRSAVSHGPTF